MGQRKSLQYAAIAYIIQSVFYYALSALPIPENFFGCGNLSGDATVLRVNDGDERFLRGAGAFKQLVWKG